MTTETRTHAHHWLLDSPTPGVREIPARCRDCDAERTYPASSPAFAAEGGAWRQYPGLRSALLAAQRERTWPE